MGIGGGNITPNTFYFIIAPQRKHPGLADRIKAIIHCYNIAKGNDFCFKLIYKTPFALEQFLQPDKIDWIADYDDLGKDIKHVRLYNETNWHKNDNILQKDYEYNCLNYIGNILPIVFEDTGYKWADLFHELFKPSPELEKMINATNLAPLSYIAVHLRFVNALEHFEDGYYNELTDSQKKKFNSKMPYCSFTNWQGKSN